MEKGRLIGKAVRAKGLKIGKLKQIPPNRSHHPWKGPREVVDAQGSAWGSEWRGSRRSPATVQISLSSSLSLSCGGGSLCHQGQEDVRCLVLQLGGALNGER